MMEGYRLPPIIFSKQEALSFVTAEKLMNRFSDYSINKDYQSALFKVKTVLRSAEKESIAKVDDSITVLPNSYIPKSDDTPFGKIMAGIESGTAVAIKYLANHSLELSNRIVEPVGVFHHGQYWHMIAFCNLRKDYRDFRLDRIQRIENTSEQIEKKHPALKTFLTKIRKDQQLTEVIIEIQRDKYRYIGDQKYYNGFISQEVFPEVVRMTFLTESTEGFARWYMMIGDVTEIIKPAGLKKRVLALTSEILKKVK
jgi:predicted DNA-binding transcriptional regulator YafY